SWIFVAGVGFPGALFIPVENTAHKGRDELDTCVRAGDCLRERKEQREITVDAFFLKFLGGLDPFPSRRDLDENAFTGNAGLFVESDYFAGFGGTAFRVEGQPSVNFCRDAAWDNFQNLQAEKDQHLV